MSRVFDHFNPAGPACPVCGMRDDKPTVLVTIDGTDTADNIAEAIQVHHECAIVQRYNRDVGVLYIKTRP